ncbi:MAG: transcriptional repressor NrdR [Clostridiales bacterium]|nr:transcriptional repressor NrdR [Clostridiales bacterium]
MKCSNCGNEESKVLDSRLINEGNSIRRRRECLKCGKRFTTFETIETTPILVIKNDQTREEFSKEKIKNGIIKAGGKRPISMSQIDEIVDEIEKEIQNSLKSEIESKAIGEMVMSKLKKLDQIAYIRFASIYREFTDVTNFINFLKNM